MVDPVRILHLDDDPMDAQLVALTLESESDEFPTILTYVRTKDAFLAALDRKDFDVILSDYRMPGYDGDDALASVLEKCPETPFIMVTGELGEERAIETLQRGAADYVLKGRIFRLIPAIRRALQVADIKRKQKEAEEALRQSRETLALAVKATNLGLFDYYPREGVLLWNNQAKEHFGLPPEASVSYQIFLRGIHHDDRERVHTALRDVFQSGSGGTYRIEYRTIGIEDKRERWLDSRGQVFWNEHGEAVRFIGTTNDITLQKKAEEDLRGREARFRSLISSSTEAIALVDERGILLAISRSGAELLGSHASELVDRDVHHFVPAAHVDAVAKSLLRLRASPDTPQFVLMRLQTEKGSIPWIELEATAITSGENVHAYFFRLRPVLLGE